MRPAMVVVQGHEPPPAPQQFRVALMESCQRDVPKSRSLQWAAQVPSASVPASRSYLKASTRAPRRDIGGHHETSPPKTFPASGSGRCGASGLASHCESTSLSVAASPHHRRLSGRNRKRHHRTPDRSMVFRSARSAVRRREPARRRRQRRRRKRWSVPFPMATPF